MKILHLNTSDINGGAARAAYRLHRGLQESGVDSSMFVRSKSSKDDNVSAHTHSPTFWARLKDRVKRHWLRYRFDRYQESRPDGLEAFSQARTVDGGRVAEGLPDADVYNLHWVRGFIDPLPFFRKTQRPVVWTVHDMNPFTGGCHYNVECGRYTQSCGRCPQLGSTEENDLSRSVWSRKRKAYRRAIEDGRLQIVAPSQWLAEEADRSTLFSTAPVQVIPYGVDHETFRPRETEGMQTALEIPSDHRIVLFVAQSAQNHRKGFDLLADALSSLAADDVTLLSIGGEEPALETALPHLHFGTIESDLLLSVFYSFADLFVIPSRQDNLPNTVLESMACGTPVVGFDTGGIPDMIRPGETGWLAKKGDVRALRESIETALSDDKTRKRLVGRCREVVENEYTLEVQASRYRDLYEQLLNQTETSG